MWREMCSVKTTTFREHDHCFSESTTSSYPNFAKETDKSCKLEAAFCHSQRRKSHNCIHLCFMSNPKVNKNDRNACLQEQAVSAAHDRPTPERASPSHSNVFNRLVTCININDHSHYYSKHCSLLMDFSDGREEVIRELSALRRLLKTEQKKLEVQMGQALPQENHHSIPSRYSGARLTLLKWMNLLQSLFRLVLLSQCC